MLKTIPKVAFYFSLLFSLLFPSNLLGFIKIETKPLQVLAKNNFLQQTDSIPLPFIESFKNSTASANWIMSGNATLTGNGITDGNGEGWLRLTGNSKYETGYIYYDKSIPANQGLIIDFDFASWGGNGADGLSFFLFDGTTSAFNIGANGGSLGFAQKCNVNGISNGYLAIGLDEFGNFSNPNECRNGGPGYKPDTVAIRGPGNEQIGYEYVTGSNKITVGIDTPYVTTRPIQTSDRYRHVTIIIEPVGLSSQITVKMTLGYGTSPVTIIPPTLLNYTSPATLKFGFAASTGAVTNYHEIRNLEIKALSDDISVIKTVNDLNGGNVEPGDTLQYSVLIKNNSNQTINSVELFDPIPDNTTFVSNSISFPASSTLISEVPNINISDLSIPALSQVNISYKTNINTPLNNGTIITNQAIINYDADGNGTNEKTINSDGDLTLSGGQPTNIIVISGPIFTQTTKKVSLTDIDGNGAASPGDILIYNIILKNTGNANANNIHFFDKIPSKTAYNIGSATASSGSPAYDSSAKTIQWVGDINAGSQINITFSVIINSSDVQIRDVISNQGEIQYDSDGNGSNDSVQLTDSDLNLPGTQPTEIMIGGRPEGIAIKTAVDINGGNLEPGDVILYTISMQNFSGFDSNGMELIDNIPNYTEIVPDSISSPTGSTIITSSPILDIQGINIPSHSLRNISFKVKIDSTIPAGVSQIENQAIIYYDTNNDGINDSNQLTDGDIYQAGNQPTILELTANANFSFSTKNVELFKDADGNQAISPGDSLRYTVNIINSGNQDANLVSFVDSIPIELTFVEGSMSSTPTTPAPIYNQSTKQINWNGNISSGSTYTIQYLAIVNSSLLPGTEINNQGEINSDNKIFLTDGNLSEPGNQPTSVTLGGQLQGLAIKSATDLNGGNLEPGDIIRYNIQMNNLSSYDALNIEFTDYIPNHCDYVPNSLSIPSSAVIISENPLIKIEGINVYARSVVNFSFKVKVNDSVPAGINSISNQGLVFYDSDGNGTNDAFQNTDGDISLTGTQPTILSLKAGPNFSNSTKIVNLLTDVDGNGVVSPGDNLLYTLLIQNTGNQDANNVTLEDLLPEQLTFVAGTIITDPINPTAIFSNGKIVWTGNIPAGSSVEIKYQANVNLNLPTGTMLENQGIISFANENYFTDGDVSQPGNQSTKMILDGEPQGLAIKSVIDLNGGNLVPGDLLRYEVLLINESNYDSINMEFTDTAPSSTKIIPSSISSPFGSVVDASETNLKISNLNVQSKSQATITFNVQVNNLIPNGIDEISNQGEIFYDSDGNGNNDSSQLTDGDLVNSGLQPTVIKIIAGPNLENTSKGVKLVIDNDGNGVVSPGDTLEYEILLSNQGNQDSDILKIIDSIPNNTSYIIGSGTATTGTFNFDSINNNIVWEGVSLANNDVLIQFQVLIDIGLNPGVKITNQGKVFDGLSDDLILLTDGDLSLPGKQTTDVIIGGSAAGFAFKTAVDKNGGNLVPGDVIIYNLVLKNTSTYPALGLEFTDPIPENTSYVNGSLVQPNGSNVVILSTSPLLQITGIDIPPNSEINFSFEVQLDSVIPAGITHISNQGYVFYDSNGDGNNDTIQRTDSDLGIVGNQNTSLDIVNIFDPPSGYKSVNGRGYPVLVWRQVWINDGNATSEEVILVDTIPQGTKYDNNSLVCIANGNSVVSLCEYQATSNQVVFVGIIDSDPGAVNENQANNEVIIEFSTVVDPGNLTAVNQGIGFWDQNGDGLVDTNDDNLRLNQFVVTDNINDPYFLNPTIWSYKIDKRIAPDTGFAPNKITILSPQPLDKYYNNIEEMRIEIPKIRINVPIVGIPIINNGWDITWLSEEVGYLYSSAYPTWAGNSYLTGHLTLPNGHPGPLYNLNQLEWGDEIIIFAWGQKYIFEVREKSIFDAKADFEFIHKDYPWITIITCKDFDESFGTYNSRLFVSAVLIDILDQ